MGLVWCTEFRIENHPCGFAPVVCRCGEESMPVSNSEYSQVLYIEIESDMEASIQLMVVGV